MRLPSDKTARSIAMLYIRVHHDLGYTVPSTKGEIAHAMVSYSSNPYYRRVRFDELDRGRVCDAATLL
jgi:hypothetical protein